MANLVKGLMADRRRRGETADNTDLLGLMLIGVDRQSGEKLPDENIVAQCITFLIAGHETTSGLLVLRDLLPAEEPASTRQQGAGRGRRGAGRRRGARLRADPQAHVRPPGAGRVAAVVADGADVHPNAAAGHRRRRQIRLPEGHRAVGADPDAAPGPQRVGRRRRGVRPRPFRAGADQVGAARRRTGRSAPACGRASAASSPCRRQRSSSAWLLQRFEFVDHRNYQLHTKSTLTVKPDDFWIKAPSAHRPGRSAASDAARGGRRGHRGEAGRLNRTPRRPDRVGHGTPLLVLFGSNLGTAEGIANRLGREGIERGYQRHRRRAGRSRRRSADAGRRADRLLLLQRRAAGERRQHVRGSAERCGLAADALPDVSYTVFGCGDTDWAATYQAVPKLLDAELERHGAAADPSARRGQRERRLRRPVPAWHDTSGPTSRRRCGLPVDAAAEGGHRPAAVDLDRQPATDQPGRALLRGPARAGARERRAHGRRHARRAVHPARRGPAARRACTTAPATTSGVLPRNSLQLIRRVMNRFDLDAGMYLTIVATSGVHTHLPIDEPAPLLGILGTCVELQATATRADIETMAALHRRPRAAGGHARARRRRR